MKVVFDDGEKERLESAYDQLRLQLFEENSDKIYGISFKVTNPALAQYILTSLLHDRLEDFDLGISVTAIHLDQIQDKSELKEKLHEMINNIIS